PAHNREVGLAGRYLAQYLVGRKAEPAANRDGLTGSFEDPPDLAHRLFGLFLHPGTADFGVAQPAHNRKDRVPCRARQAAAPPPAPRTALLRESARPSDCARTLRWPKPPRTPAPFVSFI